MSEYCSFFLMCVFSLGWNIKLWHLLDIWVQIFSTCFYIIWVCWILICRITFYMYLWGPSSLNKQNKKWPPKNTFFQYLCYTLTCNFRFLHDLELINLSVMVLDKRWPLLTFKFRMATANTHIKAFFMNLNYNIKNSTCLMEIKK